MKGEIERCKVAIDMVKNGKDTAIISTGDADFMVWLDQL